MASLASVSSFTGLKVQSLKPAGVRSATSTSRPATVVCSAAGSPWQRVGKALVATGAGIMLATSAATAATVKLGGDGGELLFQPSKITVKAGEEITFNNNKGFPHNVVFDEDNVPAGVDVGKISNEEYMNSSADSYTVKLTQPGTYGVYCEPHQGAGMSATIIVE